MKCRDCCNRVEGLSGVIGGKLHLAIICQKKHVRMKQDYYIKDLDVCLEFIQNIEMITLDDLK